MRVISIVGACLLVAACGANGSDASCPPTPPTMQSLQTRVFDGCTTGNGGCHTAAPFAANLDLTRANAWGSLVHAPSNSAPGKWRVEPGDLDGSLLWHKLTGTVAADQSEGVAMPRDGNDRWAPLPSDALVAVRCWIVGGAPAQ